MFIKYKLKFINDKEGIGPETLAISLGNKITGKFYHSDAKGWVVGETSGLSTDLYYEFDLTEISSNEVELLATESGSGAFINDKGEIELPKVIDIDLILQNQGE